MNADTLSVWNEALAYLVSTKALPALLLLCASVVGGMDARASNDAEERELLRQLIPLQNRGADEEALELARAWLARAEHKTPKDERLACLALQDMAQTYRQQGDDKKAEELLLQALPMSERAFGKHDLNTGSILNSLGDINARSGRYLKARDYLKRALVIAERDPGSKDNTAIVLVNLGRMEGLLHNYAGAEEHLLRAIGIAEASRELGPSHPRTAFILHEAAINYSWWGKYDRAIELFRDALEISESIAPDPEKSQDVAAQRLSLATAYHATQKYETAQILYEAALRTRERKYGPDSPKVRYVYQQLALLEHEQGHLESAEKYYRRALYGLGNPRTIASNSVHLLRNFSALQQQQNHLQDAVNLSRLASRSLDEALNEQLYIGTEEEKRARLNSYMLYAYLDVALSVRAQGQVKGADDLGIEAVWSYKARVMDARVSAYTVLRSSARPEDRVKLETWRTLNTRLADAAQAGQPAPTSSQQARVDELRQAIGELEADLEEGSARAQPPFVRANVELVQEALHPDTALIEFFRYSPPIRSSRDRGFAPPRYVAYILKRGAVPATVDLGPAAQIEGKPLSDLRAALRNRDSSFFEEAGRAVDKILMEPLRGRLGDVKHLYVSPDGPLHLLPFEALRDEAGMYLIERYQFTYLTSGRDLLRPADTSKPRSRPIVFADPPTPADMSASFPPLAYAAHEAAAVQAILGLEASGVQTGSRANEAALRQVGSPSILHFATHGFFRPAPRPEPPADWLAPTPGAGRAAVSDPMLRSGLILSQTGNDDGILSALEASTLDLSGTRLVVMSACETGLGDIAVGEGVYGLRRAFAIAGAQTQVMSLWLVDDRAAKDLIIDYYARLRAGGGRSAALHEAKLAMLHDASKPNRAHPYYWASFVVLGDARPLTDLDPKP